MNEHTLKTRGQADTLTRVRSRLLPLPCQSTGQKISLKLSVCSHTIALSLSLCFGFFGGPHGPQSLVTQRDEAIREAVLCAPWGVVKTEGEKEQKGRNSPVAGVREKGKQWAVGIKRIVSEGWLRCVW